MTSNQWVGGDFNDVIGVPAVASPDATHIDFFFVGLDFHLHHKWFTLQNQMWQMTKNEFPLGGAGINLQGVPAVTTTGPHSYSVFAWGKDNHLYHLAKSKTTQNWLAWDMVTKGMITSSPSVIAVSSNRMDVFFKDSMGQMSTTHWVAGGSWSEW